MKVFFDRDLYRSGIVLDGDTIERITLCHWSCREWPVLPEPPVPLGKDERYRASFRLASITRGSAVRKRAARSNAPPQSARRAGHTGLDHVTREHLRILSDDQVRSRKQRKVGIHTSDKTKLTQGRRFISVCLGFSLTGSAGIHRRAPRLSRRQWGKIRFAWQPCLYSHPPRIHQRRGACCRL